MLSIGWTTVASEEQAETLAKGLITNRLAACVQIEGPITSHYRWADREEEAKEWRLTIKFISSRSDQIRAWLERNHPYDLPEWIAVEANIVSEKYLSWARSNSTDQPL